MDYRIIKGMEDPVKVKGFLLVHFYILLASGLFGCLLVLGSVSTCLQAGSVAPLLQNTAASVVLMLSAFVVLRHLSNRRKFPPMGRAGETSNVPLHRRLHPAQRGVSLCLEEARRLMDISRRPAAEDWTYEEPESAEAEDIRNYEDAPEEP